MFLRTSGNTGQRLLCVTVILICALLTRTSAIAEPDASRERDNPMCDYTLYLQDPQQRAKFAAMRDHLHEITKRMASPDLRYQFEFKIPTNKPKRFIDEASMRCLGCHDEDGGVKQYSSGSPRRLIHDGMSKMAQAHPVGLMYERRTLENTYLKSSADFPPYMVLVYGRLSCITCHDPLNSEGNHLAEKNRGALCFACHNM